MLLKQLFLGFIGLCAGGIIAAGVFAFLAIIGVFPRLIGKTKTRGHIMLYETLIILGGVVGNVLDIYEFPLASAGVRLLAQKGAGQNLRQASGGMNWLAEGLMVWVPFVFLAVFGLAAGVFVGCLIMSLAETAKALPVMNRRIHLAVGFQYVVLGIALGKMAGALLYFSRGIGA